jgi:microcin C transport system ATP-binding protein
MEPILKVNNLNISAKNTTLVNNLSFTVNKGEIFAIVGESGSGKSLTALSILNLLKANGIFNTSGQIEFSENNLLDLSEDKMRKIRGGKISMIFQDPMTSLNPLHTIGKQLSEALTLHQKLHKDKVKDKIKKLLKQVELEHFKSRLDAYPHELSGGQRQRIMIAMALANHPQILIADEPTTALDVTVQHQILKLIRKLRDEVGLTVILISHDLTIVKNIADKVLVLKKGDFQEFAKTQEIFSNPQNPYTKKLIDAEPKDSPVASFENKAILEVSNLDITYKRKSGLFSIGETYFKAVKNVNFTLNKGQTIGVVGESGSGKTTLAKAIVRLVKSQGFIKYKEHNIIDFPEWKFKPFRKKIQIVFQDPFSSLNPRFTIGDIISEGMKAHKMKGDYNLVISDILQAMGLKPEMINRYPHQLSGGERQRIGMARSLVLKPDLLVLDEPTSALDLLTQAEILNILRNLQADKKISYLFISHDLRVIKSISHYIIVMKDGVIIEQGSNEEIFSNPKSDYTKTLIESSFLKGL